MYFSAKRSYKTVMESKVVLKGGIKGFSTLMG
jgi:hypothetical protein